MTSLCYRQPRRILSHVICTSVNREPTNEQNITLLFSSVLWTSICLQATLPCIVQYVHFRTLDRERLVFGENGCVDILCTGVAILKASFVPH